MLGHFLVEICDSLQNSQIDNFSAVIPADYTKTQKILHRMMQEKVSMSILDSGGFCGRAFQKNRKIQDFRKIPDVNIFGTEKHDYQLSKSLFCFLDEQLDFDNKMCQEFYKFANSEKMKKEAWTIVMDEFAQKMHDGGYPKDSSSGNSCNYDDWLDGTIQYNVFSLDGETYIILQIHGGADIRGGYTEPKVFRCSQGYDEFVSGHISLTGDCNCEEWYGDGECPDTWNFSKRLSSVFCRNCKEEVRFL